MIQAEKRRRRQSIIKRRRKQSIIKRRRRYLASKQKKERFSAEQGVDVSGVEGDVVSSTTEALGVSVGALAVGLVGFLVFLIWLCTKKFDCFSDMSWMSM